MYIINIKKYKQVIKIENVIFFVSLIGFSQVMDSTDTFVILKFL